MKAASVVKEKTVSSAGRRIGHQAAKAAFENTLSRISESGESRVSLSGGVGEGGGRDGSVTAPEVTSLRGEENPKVVAFVDQAKQTCRVVMENKLAVAVVVFLLTFVMLCALNPPMAQKTREDQTTPPIRSPHKIMVWSSLAAFLALVLPYGSCVVKK